MNINEAYEILRYQMQTEFEKSALEFLYVEAKIGKQHEKKREDIRLAIAEHGWSWSLIAPNMYVLVPPKESRMWSWSTMWDSYGIPHYLPKYSEGKE